MWHNLVLHVIYCTGQWCTTQIWPVIYVKIEDFQFSNHWYPSQSAQQTYKKGTQKRILDRGKLSMCMDCSTTSKKRVKSDFSITVIQFKHFNFKEWIPSSLYTCQLKGTLHSTWSSATNEHGRQPAGSRRNIPTTALPIVLAGCQLPPELQDYKIYGSSCI